MLETKPETVTVETESETVTVETKPEPVTVETKSESVTVETKSESVTYDDFTVMLAEVLLVEQEKLTPETSFSNDLFIDSLKMVEMALRIEHLGATIPTEAYWEIQTVGDAYDAYSNNHFSKP